MSDNLIIFSVQPKHTVMKKWIIGSLVGAILIFGWQFLSWEVLSLHKGAFKYTPAQETILTTLSSNLNEEGAYYMPSLPDGSSKKEKMDQMKANEGKAWAWVIYHPKAVNKMTSSMIRGFMVDFVIVLLLVVLLTKG